MSENEYKHCKKLINSAIELKGLPFPKKNRFNEVMASEYYKYGNRGLLNLQFKVEKNEEGFIITYNFITDNYSRHGQIDSNGENKILENYEGQFG